MEEIIKSFDLFISSSPENLMDVGNEIIQSIESLESCVPYIEILKSSENTAYQMLSFSVIKKAIMMHWEESEHEIQKEFLSCLNPIIFIQNSMFLAVLDLFCNTIDNDNSFIDVVNETLTASGEILSNEGEFSDKINALKIVNQMVNIYIMQTRGPLDSSVVEFLLGILEEYCNPEFYNDPERCELLSLSFATRFKVIYYAATLGRCIVDGEVPEGLREIEKNAYEMFAAVYVAFEDLEEISEYQIDIMMFQTKKLIDIALSDFSEDSLPSEMLGTLLEHIWPSFICAFNKTSNIYLISQIIRLLIMLNDTFLIGSECFLELIKMAELRQEDLEDFEMQPNVFWGNAYSPSSDDEDVSSLRNYISYYASMWAQEESEEDLIAVVSQLGGSEYEAFILSQMANGCMMFESTRGIIAEYTKSYIESVSDPINELTSLYLVGAISPILSIETKLSFLQSHMNLFESKSVAVLNAISQLLKSFYIGDDDAPIQQPEYFDYIEPENLLALTISINQEVITSDLLSVYKLVCAKHPEIIEQSADLLIMLVSSLPDIMGDDGRSNDDELAMEWSYTACNVVHILVSNLGDECCGEQLFELFQREFVDDCEPLDEIIGIAHQCILHDSPFADGYIETIIGKLIESNIMRSYSRSCSVALISAMIVHPEKSGDIYGAVFQILSLIDIESSSNEFCSLAAVLAIVLQLNGEVPIDDIFEVIVKCIESDETVLNYIAAELIASIFVQRVIKIDASFIEYWLEWIEKNMLALNRDVSMTAAILENLNSCYSEYSQRFAQIAQTIEENPESLMQLSDVGVYDLDFLNEICPPTPMFN